MEINRKIFTIFAPLFLFACGNEAIAKARYIQCPVKYPKKIRVPLGDAMIVEFPEKPKHALPGKRSFDFQYIGNDIGIQSLRSGARANLFVYLGKKRCAFKLVTSPSAYADDVVIVTYPKEKSVEVKYVE